MSDPILDALDPEQRQVATSLDAPLVVLAGAGTGKTRAITHRIAYAVREQRYRASATLAVTFTTRAAGEMKSRLARLGVRGAQARTIHAAALRQCQYFWPQLFSSDFPPVVENPFALVGRAANRVLGSADTSLLRDLEAEISWAKSSNVTADRYPELAAAAGRQVSQVSAEQVVAVMRGYEQAKSDIGQVDFSDILLCAASLLAEHPAVAAQIRGSYRHFVVDEYQDVSALQHRLISLWVADRSDICVVGDPNQAIHEFAGARADFLLNFDREYEGVKQLHLVRNYRSSPQILKLANGVLRLPAGAVGLRATKPEGDAPQFQPASSETQEVDSVIDWLQQRHSAGTSWSELAVLYRINAQSPELEAALAQARIPYSVRGTERFYERPEVRTSVTALLAAAQSETETEPKELAERVLTKAGWSPQPPSGMGKQRERWESLTALLAMIEQAAAAKDQWSLAEFAAWLQDQSALQAPPTAEAVTLSTMHAAKGLEWDDVAVIGVREGLMPFSLCQSEAELAGERRLLHVAFTRARNQLRVSWASGNQKRNPSRFLTGLLPRSAKTQSVTSRKSERSRACSVCGGALQAGSERKLARHLACEVAYDETLFAELKAWRLATATAASLPAFVVFTDATLRAIAEREPKSAAELMQLPGIGSVKAERYGDQCLAVIAEHLASRSS